jgi:hypothetical protein
MAFNATPEVAETAYDKIRAQARASKQYLTNQRAVMVQATTSAVVPLAVIQHFAQVIPLINAWASTPGLAQYARDQQNDPAYDIVAEFQAMRNAMVSARDNLVAGFPKDPNGWILYQSLNPDGTFSYRTFTAAQLASAVAQIDAVIAAIN